MESITKNIRATIRAALGIPFVVAVAVGTAVQMTVVGPVFKNYSTIPNLIYKGMRAFLGIKVEFNKASAPIEKNKQAWFVANHMSIADFAILGGQIEATFAGKGDILTVPVISTMARAVKMIGIRRENKYSPQARAKFIENFNAGYNAMMFPEGTTSEGKEVHLFRQGLITLLFGEKGVDKTGKEVTLQKEVVVQPIAIRITNVNDQNAIGRDDLRNLYSMYHEDKWYSRIWKRLQVKNITAELTVFDPLNPKDFNDAKDLINKAALDIAGVVNPGQTTFVKKEIPVKVKQQP